MRIEVLQKVKSLIQSEIEDLHFSFTRTGLCGIFISNTTSTEYLEFKRRIVKLFPEVNLTESYCWPKDDEGMNERIKFVDQWIAELQEKGDTAL
jgi:hypothetical protein